MKKIVIALAVVFSLPIMVFAQQKATEGMGAIVSDVRYSESYQDLESGMDGFMSDITVRITPYETVETTAALCFQEGEMEAYRDMAGMLPSEMFDLYEEAVQSQQEHSTYQAGEYDTIFHARWDTCNFVIWVDCKRGADRYIVSQLVPSKASQITQSINEMTLPSISVYPNPVSSYLNIECTNAMDKIELLNTVGQSVYVKQSSSKQETINLESIDKGVYILKIDSGKQNILKKIVVR